MIELEGVSARHGETTVLHNLWIRFESQRRTVLLGRSGSGKSTLLRLINRLMLPSTGTILYGKQPIGHISLLELRRSIGFVSQHLGLFPHWTARKQIERFHSHPEGVEKLAASLGLEPSQLDRYPHQLSGGQQQRVALARALASNPPVLLLDEPFSALDPLLRRELQNLVMGLDKTILFVTHDIREALRLGDRIVFLRAGHIAYNGPAHQIHAADDLEVRAYLETLES